jgi:ribA/ribD-fused uncharacterized protein
MSEVTDLESLLTAVRHNQPLKYLFFWGHQPHPDGRITPSCFSQWWPSAFAVEGVRYETAEHYMMAGKARLFNDEEMYDKILAATHPHAAKKYGRQVRNFDPVIWEQHRFDIVVQGNLAKFSQHADLQTYLLNTNTRILVEASPVDTIWGIGWAADDPKVNDPEQWRGLNLLGFALMQVRLQLNH